MAARREEMGNRNPNPNPMPMVDMEMGAALALTEMAKIETTESGRLQMKKRINNGFPDLEISRSNKAEKEARSIRRVLANRESARQTILRRQALQEELVKKVADLSMDNENMKMEKELAMKEYLSLKDRNKQLKEQMDKTDKCKVMVGVEFASTQPETSSSPSTELSLVSSSKTPCAWPPRPSTPPGTTACHEEGNQSSASASMTHFYVPSQTWFYPLHRHTSPSDHPSFFHSSNDQDVDSVGRQHCRGPVFQKMDISERRYMHDGNKPSVPSTAVTSSEVTNTRINLEELPIERELALHKKAEKKTNELHIATPRKEQLMFIQSRKASVDPAVAAEARKRRKELKNLKFLHGRQIRLHG